MAVRYFGTLADGTPIQEVTIAAGDLSVDIITLGAIIRDARLAGVAYPLVLGCETLADYVDFATGFGALMGRCANRIAHGRFTLDGKDYQLSINRPDGHHIHGGVTGFSRRGWRLVSHAADTVTLAISASNGEEGYPGNVEVRLRYSIEAPATIRMEISATADAPTVVNLAQHSYFNLDDSPDILDHRVQIFADAYTPTDGDNIPTGDIAPVAGSDFDFRSGRPIRQMRSGERIVFDKNFVIARRKSPTPIRQALLSSDRSGISMEVASTEPGLQFYDGDHLGRDIPGLGGRNHGRNAGCCFESQFFPDAINHEGFPSPILRPDETYRQTTTYAFAAS